MSKDIHKHHASIQAYIAEAFCIGDVTLSSITPMPHGASDDNFALLLAPHPKLQTHRRHLVLRREPAPPRTEQLSRAHEFAVLRTVNAANVRAPEALLLCEDPSVAGRPFFIMEQLHGVAAPNRLVKEETLVPDRAELAYKLGEAMGRLHTITPGRPELAFMRAPHDPAQAFVEHQRKQLDALPLAQPAFELGLRWCERHAPKRDHVALLHRDFRTGNFLVNHGELAGILDWEHAAFGDPVEDIGWFFARCWRFGRADRQAGGIGPSDAFFKGYHAVRQVVPDAQTIHFWEVAAHIRFGVTAMQHAQRHMLGHQPSLELALAGRIPSELAHGMLRLMSEAYA